MFSLVIVLFCCLMKLLQLIKGVTAVQLPTFCSVFSARKYIVQTTKKKKHLVDHFINDLFFKPVISFSAKSKKHESLLKFARWQLWSFHLLHLAHCSRTLARTTNLYLLKYANWISIIITLAVTCANAPNRAMLIWLSSGDHCHSKLMNQFFTACRHKHRIRLKITVVFHD